MRMQELFTLALSIDDKRQHEDREPETEAERWADDVIVLLSRGRYYAELPDGTL